ncbi:MAG: phosphatase PAP2 family protein [Bacteroidia bacterium]|nr:phosphatase PAP2 family protein [Bacteroidia bacterium]
MLEWLNKQDTNLFLILNGFHSPFWDTIMWWVSQTITWIPLYCFVLYLIIKKFGKQSFWLIFIIIIVIVFCDQLSVHLCKNIFIRFRPSHNSQLQELIHLVNGYKGGSYGFVSSHAANTFGFAVITSLILKKLFYTIPIFFWAGIVSYSRIYLGVHYPGDILGGIVLGSVIALAVYIVSQIISRRIRQAV